jgi:hypothetical protein
LFTFNPKWKSIPLLYHSSELTVKKWSHGLLNSSLVEAENFQNSIELEKKLNKLCIQGRLWKILKIIEEHQQSQGEKSLWRTPFIHFRRMTNGRLF